MPSISWTMRSQLFFLAQLPFLASASTTTAYFIKPLGTDVPVVASVVAVNSALTTYAMGCGADFPPEVQAVKKEELCPSLSGITVTQGTATLAYSTMVNMGEVGAAPTNLKAALHCALAGTTQAVCTNSFEGVDKVAIPTGLEPELVAEYKSRLEGMKTPETNTYTGTDMPPMGDVLVTAGAEKLSAGAMAVTTGPSATGNSTVAAAKATSGASIETNPVGGGVNTTVPKTTSKPAYVTPTGGTASTSGSAAKATTSSKSVASSTRATADFGLLIGLVVAGIFCL